MRARFPRLILPIILIASACSRLGDVTGPHVSSAYELLSQRRMYSVIGGNGTSPSPAGLRACYAGENSGAEVINHLDGAAVGAVSYVPGKFGQAFSFDALGGIVSVPANPLLDVGPGPGMTMSVWFYSRGIAYGLDFGAGPMMEYNFGAQLWQYSEQHSYDALYTNMAQSNTIFSQLTMQHGVVLNQWNHAAVTWDKATGHMAIYLNGDVAATKDTASFSPSTNNGFNIGGRQNGSFQGGQITFNGMLDEVQIYDHALTPAEVMQLATATGTMCVSPPTQFQLVQPPVGSGESGVPFTTQPVVTVLNADGGIVPNAVTPVTATLTGTGTLTGTTTVNAVNGVATFTNLAIAGNGTGTLSFTAGQLPVATGTSATTAPITVVQVARQLAVSTQPGSAVTGSPINPAPAVQIRDAAGLPMASATNAVTVSVASGLGVISGTTTVNAVSGIAAFPNISVTGLGGITLAFNSTGLTSATSSSFNVLPLPASQLVISSQPSGAESGVALTTQPVVQLLDGANNLVVTATNAVTVSIASGNGTLSGTKTVNALGGVATFTDLKVAGSGPVTLAFTAGSPLNATSGTFPVTQVVRELVLITAPSSNILSGLVMSPAPVVELRDAAGLKVTTATDAVSVTAAGVLGILSGTTTVNAVAGTATFSNLILTGLTGSGSLNFALAAAAGGGGVIVVTSPPLQVQSPPTYGTATKLVITTQPHGAESGVLLTAQPVVEIRDASGNLVANSTVAVTVAVYNSDGTLSGTKTVNAVAGVATFTNLVLAGHGTSVLKFSSTGLTSASSSSFSLTQVVRQIVITTQPGATTSGKYITPQPTVVLKDGAGLQIRTQQVVTATIASGTGGTLSGDNTESADCDSDITFDQLKITGSGSYAIKFSVGSLSVTSASFTVSAAPAYGPAAKLALTAQPSSAESGVAFTAQPVIEIRDSNGNKVANSTIAVTVTVSDCDGTLLGTKTVNAIAGVATFTDLKIAGHGSQKLKFSANNLSSAYTNSFNVTQVARSMHIKTQPAASISGKYLSNVPEVQIFDGAGIAMQSGATITVSIASGSGTLSGDNTEVVDGEVDADFDQIKINGTGNFTLKFTSGGLSVVSNSFTVSTMPAYAWYGFSGDVTYSNTNWNNIRAGSKLDVEFSLGSNKGNDIYEDNYPAWRYVSCSTQANLDNTLNTIHVDDDDSHEGWGNWLRPQWSTSKTKYEFDWKTQNSWAGKCVALVVKFDDGSSHSSFFKFSSH